MNIEIHEGLRRPEDRSFNELKNSSMKRNIDSFLYILPEEEIINQNLPLTIVWNGNTICQIKYNKYICNKYYNRCKNIIESKKV